MNIKPEQLNRIKKITQEISKVKAPERKEAPEHVEQPVKVQHQQTHSQPAIPVTPQQLEVLPPAEFVNVIVSNDFTDKFELYRKNSAESIRKFVKKFK